MLRGLALTESGFLARGVKTAGLGIWEKYNAGPYGGTRNVPSILLKRTKSPPRRTPSQGRRWLPRAVDVLNELVGIAELDGTRRIQLAHGFGRQLEFASAQIFLELRHRARTKDHRRNHRSRE